MIWIMGLERFKKIVFYTILLCIYGVNLNATSLISQQKYILNHGYTQNNIVGQSIQTIYEDKYGILWLGVESVGLSKYNGKSHTVFKNDSHDESTISNNYIHKIVEDDSWYLWVGTANGLNRLDRRKEVFKRYFQTEDSSSLTNNLINDIVKDKNGNLWIATANGISILNTKTEQFIRLYNNINDAKPELNNFIHTIHIDEFDDVWIGTALYGMLKIAAQYNEVLRDEWNEATIKKFLEVTKVPRLWELDTPSLQQGDIRYITSNNSDTLWVSGENGLYYFIKSLEKFKKVYFLKYGTRFLNNTTYSSLLVDSDNVLWAGTTNNGVVVIDLNLDNIYPHHISVLDHSINGLKSGYINKIIESKSGLIWFATKFEGLHFYDKAQQKFPVLKRGSKMIPGLASDDVTAILEVENELWFGTASNGISIYKNRYGKFTHVKREYGKKGLQTNKINSLLKDEENNIWIGTDVGLSKTNIKNTFFQNYLDFPVSTLAKIDDDIIWVGTHNGLFSFSVKEKRIKHFETKFEGFFNTENNIEVTKILFDKDSVAWIATNTTGLFYYDIKKDILLNYRNNINDVNSIGCDQVQTVYEDNIGNIWVGTKSSGLSLFDRNKKKFIQKTTTSQISSNSVYQIIEDDRGRLWLGTGDGIIQYNPWTEEFVSYANVQGLQHTVFDPNVSYITEKGCILMGGSRGVNVFDPKNVSLSDFKAPMIISSISEGTKRLVVDLDYSSHQFVFENNKKPITFEFALLDYAAPEKNNYKYILEPFDDEWIDAGDRNIASYLNLPPGKYKFKAVGVNPARMTKSNAVEINFVVPTPYWKKFWFKALILFIVIITLIAIFHLKTFHSKQREKELKKLVRERTDDLYKANKKLSEFNAEIEERNKNLIKQRDKIHRQNLELEMHRNQLEEMVFERTKDLETEKTKAQESDKLKSAFLANMSHEIRTPLNAIMGFIDLLQEDVFEENEKIEIGNIIYQNSNDLLQLVNDIIDISIIESNQLVLKKQDVNFNKFLINLKKSYATNGILTEKKLRLNLILPEEGVVINTDKSRVQQIYINLLNNAIKFTDNGEVNFGFKIEKEKKRIVCFVSDTGIGISKENQKMLFKRFNKIEPTFDKVHRGTGLGLSISKNLSELLGGQIGVKSEEGKGSTFCFWLPL